MGIHIESIRDLSLLNLPKVRIRFADVYGDVTEFDTEALHTAVSEEAEVKKILIFFSNSSFYIAWIR